MNKAGARTAGPKSRISRSGDAKGRCSASSLQARPIVSLHPAVYNTFNLQRHLVSRRTLRIFRAQAMAAWLFATMAA